MRKPRGWDRHPAGKEKVLLYVVKENKLHQYPVSKGCKEVYTKEQLRDTIPHGVEECAYCMRTWPAEKK